MGEFLTNMDGWMDGMVLENNLIFGYQGYTGIAFLGKARWPVGKAAKVYREL